MSVEPEAGPVLQPTDAELENRGLSPEEIEDAESPDAGLEPIAYSGTDFDAEGLVRRLNRGDIVVPNFGHDGSDDLELAPFQRGFVWRKNQMDRFIESLLLGFPIPGIMLVEQSDKRYLVLDGQQRLKTLQAFYANLYDGEEFALHNVGPEFEGLTYETLSPAQKRTLDNTFIQATIVKSDGSEASLESVYQVFERLNSGGTQLTPHEIRIALYPGEFVRFLEELNTQEAWRELYGAKSLRLRDQELVLRVLAFHMRGNEYRAPLKHFLNKFLGDHRALEGFDTDDIRSSFEAACAVLSEAGARTLLRRAGQRFNVALLEAVVVGAMSRLSRGDSLDVEKVKSVLQLLAEDDELHRATISSTTTNESVRTRFSKAEKAFAYK